VYAVVGCSECDALWVVEGRPETTRCRRCSARRQFDSLKKFAETDDEEAAREARSRLLADRSGHEIDDFSTMSERAEDAGLSDEAYLAGSGLDPDEVGAATDRAEGGWSSNSRREILDEALRELDAPTEDGLVAYAADRGVPEGYVRDALAKLVRSGAVTESGGEYRLL